MSDLPKWLPWLTEESRQDWEVFKSQQLPALQQTPPESSVACILPELAMKVAGTGQQTLVHSTDRIEDIFKDERMESNVSNIQK